MQDKKIIRKSGRTLVLRANEDFTSDNLKLNGLLQHNNLQNGKHFLVFDTIENSNNAFKILKNDYKISVRFAYYRIFFTMNNIDNSIDYLQLKNQHCEWITQNSGAEVLYYKQYMKDNKYIGCGDFTIDTKESMDKLLDKDGLKNYTIEALSGSYYRYNKKTPTTELNKTTTELNKQTQSTI